MSDTTETTLSKSPSHLAYHVRENKGKSHFNRIGVAWQHKDQKGFNIEISCMPIDGRICLRVISETKE